MYAIFRRFHFKEKYRVKNLLDSYILWRLAKTDAAIRAEFLQGTLRFYNFEEHQIQQLTQQATQNMKNIHKGQMIDN